MTQTLWDPLLRVHKAGGALEDTGIELGPYFGFGGFPGSEESFYLLDGSTISVIDRDGHVERMLALDGALYERLVLDDGRLFFATYTCDRIGSAAVDGTDLRVVTQSV